ncbi:phage terminase large subunit family protein [Pelotomaculum propionicicum]|nr:phage terminase large subunit family protein [Pelotomaculum propionicicum]
MKTIRLFRGILKAVAPPPKLTVSEWADRHRRLSSENAAEPGQWRTDRAPYQREIMDSVTQAGIEKVVVEASSQTGKSEVVNNIIGRFIDVDPCPILMVQPTIETAEDYSKRRITPMIADTEVLTTKVSDSKTRDLNNTILMKVFPGGFLAMGGANSPAGLASRPIRVLLCDEVDRFPDSAGSEGDPISLAEKRTTTFWNRKLVFVSTPTIKGASRIEQEYELGTQEKWCVKCPGCGRYHFIVIRDIKFDHQKHESNKRTTYIVDDVWWRCPSCLDMYDEYTMKKQPAMWIADNPEAIQNGIRSFRLNSFVSPWYSWKRIIQEFLESKDDPEKYKVFVNTVLGESWEERGEFEDETALLERREEYKADLPDGVLVLTMAVDTQDDRLEYEVTGYGRDEESWGIEKGIIWGKPDDKNTWKDLDDKLSRTWHFADGSGLVVACTFVDSGGHFTDEVYRYCGARLQKRVFAIKGQGGSGVPLVYKISRNNKYKLPLIMLGVDSGKTSIMQRLKIGKPGPKYCHYPVQEERGYDQVYFKGLISEKQVIRKEKGKTVTAWENIAKDKRNEPLDLRVYGLAALRFLNPNFEALERRLKQVSGGVETTPKPAKKAPKKRYGSVKRAADY